MTNQETETILRNLLIQDGYKLSQRLENGYTGVDILAQKDDEKLFIEVIGCKKSNPARSKDFFEAFFRAISRLNNQANLCVIALPNQFKNGMPIRFMNYEKGWIRIGNSFPELKIWFISTDTIDKFDWNDIQNFKN